MEKLYWAELRKAIAQRINADEQEVAQFMNALAPAITKALQEDRQVRITNFGTFKLQSIAPRKSININTGESFTIPGYDKLTFTPESSIKELIGNLNEAPKQTMDDTTPLKKLDEQATEIVGILSDLGQAPVVAENKPTEETSHSEEQTDENQQNESNVEPIVEPIAEQTNTYTTMTEEKKEEIIVNDEPTKETNGKKSRTWLVVGITVLLFAILLALVFLFIGNRFVAWVEGLHDKNGQTEIVEAQEVADVQLAPEDIQSEPVSTLPYPYVYTEFIAEERLPKGSRLAWLARKYYNERDLWVFIFEANRDVVEHPSDIIIGTRIRIPKLPEELQDLSNPELRNLVDRLAEEYKQL